LVRVAATWIRGRLCPSKTPAGDIAGLERLVRYLLRAPLSLERLELEGAVARYRHKRAKRAAEELFDRLDLLARLLMHIPAPRLHIVRYYGHYASAARAARRRDAEVSEEAEDTENAAATLAQASDDDRPSSAHRRRLRRQWARVIRRVYEADPFLPSANDSRSAGSAVPRTRRKPDPRLT
jgi:hypothetical protein